jgi:uncharacterized membrane protein YdbT with pleckstrin-like domain
MAFPEKLLAEDEEIVEHLHPHWLTLVPAVLSFIVVCALAGVSIAFLPDSTTHHNAHRYLLIAIIVIGLLLTIWFTIAPVLRWRSTHYVITTHRVLIRRGVLKHRGRDITLGRISDVSYEQSLADRIVRSGSLSIESASENGQETLVNIPRADKIQQTLNRLVEADSMRRSRPYDTGGYAQGAPFPVGQEPAGGYPTSQYPPEQDPGDTTRYR